MPNSLGTNIYKMCEVLQKLKTKAEIDAVIKSTEDLVLVLRFGRDTDIACLQLDHIMEKSAACLRNMATIYTIDVDSALEYACYFDISLVPATVFFFNGQHMKVDWGRPDNTKFIGSFKTKQDFIDVIETIYRGAMRGKLIVNSPLDPVNVPKYDLIYKNI